MNAFEKIALEKIREAIANGEFDNLPGKGKPLMLDDEPDVPRHLRMSFKILKNANILPEEVQLRKDIHLLQQQLAAAQDELEQRHLRRQIRDCETRFNILMERHRRQLTQ
ncbi:DUF1992 domain-containing protein [candidate division KSB1 bacterium]|nr:MAG: DUF1992 domain-containing protein [candidate division KSB1 bacterium]MBC6946817.1 DUF1992 domain-containing protein [candidate division KSB1 bacterium]MCE7942914.1 DUF1992 domain-containing protein [Chlorobi bacterium CHB1]MDL1873721.1 DUF1992 domain-containing protein [Cytophagia bacterium CHB2]